MGSRQSISHKTGSLWILASLYGSFSACCTHFMCLIWEYITVHALHQSAFIYLEENYIKKPPNKTNKAKQNKIRMKKAQVGICNILLLFSASSGVFKSMKSIAVLQVTLPPSIMLQSKCRRLMITWTDDSQRDVLQRVHRNKGASPGLW